MIFLICGGFFFLSRSSRCIALCMLMVALELHDATTAREEFTNGFGFAGKSTSSILIRVWIDDHIN